jgi:hypothetical protein
MCSTGPALITFPYLIILNMFRVGKYYANPHHATVSRLPLLSVPQVKILSYFSIRSQGNVRESNFRTRTE